MEAKNRVIPPSPFIDNRKEREPSSSKIYINYEDYSHWANDKNCLIKGSRGTGKSSVLTVFDYKTQWFRPEILLPIDEFKEYFPSKPNVIGLLFRCDCVEINLWENWRNKYSHDNNNAEIIFSTYLNYYFIEKIVGAITDILNGKKEALSDNPNIPLLISEILKICYPESQKRPILFSHSLESLKEQIRETLFSIRQRIYSWEPFECLSRDFSLHTPALPIINEICNKIIEIIPFFKSMKFFLLLDDVDRFDDWHTKVINSIMKVVTAPCSFKLSCTTEYKTMLTVDNITISNTDLHISNLNDEEESGNDLNKSKIDELFNAIFNIRVSNIKGLDSNYDIKKVFGDNKIEDNILEVLNSKSISKEVKSLLDDFKSSKKEKITDFWLLKNEILKDENNRKEFDKYRVSAAFSILHFYNLKGSFNYCSYDLVRLISSGSPRHFLRICNAMWEDIYLRLIDDNFPVGKEAQHKAIKQASDDLFENIDKERFDNEISVSCRSMCERLSEIFIKFIGIESLRITPECLSIQIDEGLFKETAKISFRKIIDKLIMIEAIKVRKELNNSKIKIALNPMLAPHFCLPYRSPFSYSQTITEPLKFLFLLQEAKEETVNMFVEERVGKKKKRGGKNKRQTESFFVLFENEEK